jgi:hypothetical protein
MIPMMSQTEKDKNKKIKNKNKNKKIKKLKMAQGPSGVETSGEFISIVRDVTIYPCFSVTQQDTP